jgi:hypothetical protein
VKPTLAFDIETFVDYFLVAFRNIETGNVRMFEMFEGEPLDVNTLRRIVRSYRLISFNGTGFDVPLLTLALQGADCKGIKRVADKIILNNLRHWQLGIEPIKCDHVDLIEIAPGVASLKVYAGRLHYRHMQDLPFAPDADIRLEDRPILRSYCANDLGATVELFNKLKPQIELRERMSEEYGLDLRSKSDAQIAEAVLRHEVEKTLGRKLPKEDPYRLAGKTFRYDPPAFFAQRVAASTRFHDIVMSVARAGFSIGGNGVVQMPKELKDLKVTIGEGVYRMGIGGLHSSETSTAHIADDEHLIVDRDVTSYYPSIALACGLAPEAMGKHFTAAYRRIVERRVAAKRAGDTVTADSLKITINGTFGKFGSPYSVLYAPRLMIQTTVTGQLALLMLIDMLEEEGIPVVSANTDGVVIKCPRSQVDVMELIVMAWETMTGFETEATEYRAIYSRDVNNYVALKASGGYKSKGAYAPSTLAKNPNNEIVTDAVIRYLLDTIEPVDTVNACRDIRKFVTIRQVKGGAIWQGQELGRAVRWYYAYGELDAIHYKINGYTVPKSEGARPVMELPEQFPDDVNLEWYVAEAEQVLHDIGAR